MGAIFRANPVRVELRIQRRADRGGIVNGSHFEAWTRSEPDIYFWSPILTRKPNLLSKFRYAQLGGIKKRSVHV